MVRVIFILFFFSFFITSAQTGLVNINRNDSRINDAYTDIANRIASSDLNSEVTNFKGNPYFESTFRKAKVFYFDKALKDEIYLRYNAANDELEMSFNALSKEAEQALIKNKNIYCTIGKSVFRYLPLSTKNTNSFKFGYVREIYKGKNYSLYRSERKIFREAKKARTSMERSFAARFIDEFKLYFQKNEGPLEFIKPKKKSLKQFFKSDLNHFETYLKNNQGDLNEVDYLRGLVEYMDELN